MTIKKLLLFFLLGMNSLGYAYTYFQFGVTGMPGRDNHKTFLPTTGFGLRFCGLDLSANLASVLMDTYTSFEANYLIYRGFTYFGLGGGYGAGDIHQDMQDFRYKLVTAQVVLGFEPWNKLFFQVKLTQPVKILETDIPTKKYPVLAFIMGY